MRHVLSSRHLRWEIFEERIYKGPPSVEPVAGSPTVQLFIEAGGRRIGARFYTSRSITVPSPLAEVSIREVRIGRQTALEVSTGNQILYRDFYSLCCSIADRVQIDKHAISVAVTTTLKSWAALIRSKSLLSSERQIGLLGELLFLQRAAQSIGWLPAARSWFGPDSEEHDFVLPLVDAEVKSTTREQRIHQITSLMQLQPKAGRRLQFLSVQLTLGGGSKGSFSLPTTVAIVIASAERASSHAAELIRDQIRYQGWDDEDVAYYTTRYRLRAPLMTVPISTGFPAIRPNTLASIGADAVARISNVSYSINVDELGVLDKTKQFERALFGRRSGR
jgi:hypothetical protein